MKFYALIAAKVCTIWLGFEPHPDQSLDPGSADIDQKCKADSAESNGQISMKFYG